MNSFKEKVYINKEPFALPTEKTWNGIENYLTAINKYDLLSSVGWTVFYHCGFSGGHPCMHLHVCLVYYKS